MPNISTETIDEMDNDYYELEEAIEDILEIAKTGRGEKMKEIKKICEEALEDCKK